MVIRHRSVKPMCLAQLEIRIPSLKKPITQEVIITGRDGNQVTVEHANDWTRTLQTQSGSSDGSVYVETDPRTPKTVTFRLLSVEDQGRAA